MKMNKCRAIQYLETRIWHFECTEGYDRLPALYDILNSVKTKEYEDYSFVETVGLDWNKPPIVAKIITTDEYDKVLKIELIT